MLLDPEDTSLIEPQPISGSLVKKQKSQAGLDAIYEAFSQSLLILIFESLCDNTLLNDQFPQKPHPSFQ
jgi:hypothetical protein